VAGTLRGILGIFRESRSAFKVSKIKVAFGGRRRRFRS
jgi:hypothetical protein